MMIVENPDNEKSGQMSKSQISRRSLLKSSLSFCGAAVLLKRTGRADGFMSANDRPLVGATGTSSRGCQNATGVDGPWGSAPVCGMAPVIPKRDKPAEAAIPKTGDGAMTKSEPRSARPGKVTGGAFSVRPRGNARISKGSSSSFTSPTSISSRFSDLTTHPSLF